MPIYIYGLPIWYTDKKKSACQYKRCSRCSFHPWVGKILWSRKWQPTPLLLPGKFHGQRSLMGHHPWVTESNKTEHTHISYIFFFSFCTHCLLAKVDTAQGMMPSNFILYNGSMCLMNYKCVLLLF